MPPNQLTHPPDLFKHQPHAAWLVLVRAPGLGPKTVAELLTKFSHPTEMLAAAGRGEDLGLRRGVQAELLRPDWTLIEQDLTWLQQPNHHLITLTDVAYPERLRQLAMPPFALFVTGDPDLLSLPSIAVVGSRNASRSGYENAHAFAQELARQRLCVVSGMATGIDTAAHQGALAGEGATIAVLGTGADIFYPSQNRLLAMQIAQHGALISEMPLGTTPHPGHFPRRNRIISGLSLGVLVVEASLRSGSLSTAAHAVEQGREVFAIPGSIHNPRARGCHRLIRDGAKLVESAADIMEELQVDSTRHSTPATTPGPELESGSETHKIWGSLGPEGTEFDQIVTAVGLTPDRVSSILLYMELEGLVAKEADGRYTRLR